MPDGGDLMVLYGAGAAWQVTGAGGAVTGAGGTVSGVDGALAGVAGAGTGAVGAGTMTVGKDVLLAVTAVLDGSSVLDKGPFGAHNTDKVVSGFPTSQGQSHWGGRPSRDSGIAVLRDIYGGARSPSATEDSFSSWRAPD